MLGSPVDIAIVAAVVLVVFGPKKVPELGRALGQGIGNFKRALTDAQDEMKSGMKVDETAGTHGTEESKHDEERSVAASNRASSPPQTKADQPDA